MELVWLVISIGKSDCGDTGIGKINSGKHIPRGCVVSGNAFAIEQAPPTLNGGMKSQLTIQMFFARMGYL